MLVAANMDYFRMADIILATRGTHGDHLPFMILGRELTRRGHHVRLGINPAMHWMAADYGLDFFTCGPAMGREQAQQGAAYWNHWEPMAPVAGNCRMVASPTYANLVAECKQADLLVCSSIFHMGPIVKALLDMPVLHVCNTPAQVCLRKEVHSRGSASLSSATEKANEASKKWFFHGLAELCSYLDLPDSVFATGWWKEQMRSIPMILAASPYFAHADGDYASVLSTGFLLAENSPSQLWKPDPELARFMDADPAPVVLSWSSLPVQNPKQVVQTHVRAARELGRRLVIQKGWAGFKPVHLSAKEREHVLLADYVPHDWLFPRAEAVIIHGGTGTVGRALKHGCPMLVEPFGNDQFYNALRVVELWAGAAVHPLKVTAKGMASVLEKKVLSRPVTTSVNELKAYVQRESGLKNACDRIEDLLP